jgi:hypothetical protein
VYFRSKAYYFVNRKIFPVIIYWRNISFENRIVHENLPSALVLAYGVLSKIRISSLAYGIVCVNRRVTYITNEVLTSRHNCVSDLFAYDLHARKRLANCKLYTNHCSAHPSTKFPSEHCFVVKKSHSMFWHCQCHCKLCVKDGPASLKSLCVNKLGKFTYYANKLKKRTNCKCKKK